MADLLTIDDCLPFLGMTSAGDSTDMLNLLIDSAATLIESVTNRSLETATNRTEYHDGTDVIVLHPPILSLSGVTDNAQYGKRTLKSTNWIKDTDDGGVNFAKGRVELWKTESAFTTGRLSVCVNYVGGWTTTTLPADLKQAWIELVCFWFDAPDRVGAKGGSAGGQSVQWEGRQVPGSLLSVFKKYKIYRRGFL